MSLTDLNLDAYASSSLVFYITISFGIVSVLFSRKLAKWSQCLLTRWRGWLSLLVPDEKPSVLPDLSPRERLFGDKHFVTRMFRMTGVVLLAVSIAGILKYQVF
ncbi:MAG: hypothetical protein IBX68_06350 [Dehalococcoidia bacterium]|nr:hypothetical protein [Dehalococcoidia bacterium]